MSEQSLYGRDAGARLIESIFSDMNAERVPYCVVGSNISALPEIPESDIDIICAPSLFKRMRGILEEAAKRQGALPAQLVRYKHCAYRYDIFVSNGRPYRYARIDITTDFVWKGRLLLTADWMLKGRRVHTCQEGHAIFYKASPEREFKYYLFKKIVKGEMDEGARCHLMRLLTEEREECRRVLRDTFSDKLANNLEEIIRTPSLSETEWSLHGYKRPLYRRVRGRKFGILAKEGVRLVDRIVHPVGWVTAVLGPDGSGKSTVLEKLPDRCGPLGRRNACFHLMPTSGSRRRGRAPVTNPHAEPAHGAVFSALKLLYLVCRYNAGWLASVWLPYRRSAFVYFDRYYHDMVADPLRYRMGAPAWVVRFMGKFIPKPDIFLILDVAPDVARARKREVSQEESQRLFHAYRDLAEDLPNAVLIDANAEPCEVVAQCEKAIVEVMAQRLRQRKVVP